MPFPKPFEMPFTLPSPMPFTLPFLMPSPMLPPMPDAPFGAVRDLSLFLLFLYFFPNRVFIRPRLKICAPVLMTCCSILAFRRSTARS